jgi:sortase A
MTRSRPLRSALGLTVVTTLLVSACVAPEDGADAAPSSGRRTARPDPSSRAEPTAPATRPSHRDVEPTSDGRPRRARLTIAGLELRDLAVVPYRGHTDDAAGTAIQDRGRAASPFGPDGGVGPGGVGNYQVTAHRLSSTRAFEFLPRLRRGAEVVVEAAGLRHVDRIVGTRVTSFRSPRSLREQRAAVPGRPGREPVRAMITLSTCATVEDHAAGNYWADRFHNPEHRIDKIGVLVATGRL